MQPTAWKSLCLAKLVLCGLTIGPAAAESPTAGGFGRLEHIAVVSRASLAGSTSVCISSDGQHLYATGWNADAVTAFKRDATGRLEFLQTIQGSHELNAAACVRTSPDDRYVFAVGLTSQSLVLFERNPSSGKLVRQHLVHSGSAYRGFFRPVKALFSPDSKFVYVVDPNGSRPVSTPAGMLDSGAIAVFDIQDGKIAWIETQIGREGCLHQAKDAAISPSGDALFVAGAGLGAISVFARSDDSGRLTLRHIVRDDHDGVHGLAGVAGVACSPDGRHLYSSAGRYHGDDAVTAFEIGSDHSLRVIQEFLKLHDFIGGSELVVSPDGRNVYATASRTGTVACFERDPQSGKLHYFETVSDGVAESRPFGAAGICISPDGRFVYLACEDKNAISIFRRHMDSPALERATETDG